jgi:AraC-like DNA-binding protein
MVSSMEDKIEYQHVTDAPGLTLSEGRFSKFSFDRHYHLDYHIGLVVEGVQRQNFQRKSELLGPGSIVLMPPDEMHDGLSYEKQSYTQKMFRISPELLNSNITEFSGKPRDAKFNGHIVENQMIWRRMVALHNMIQNRKSLAQLSIEETWLLTLEPLFNQLSLSDDQIIKGGLSGQHIRRVRDYCYAYLGDTISLESLASLCGLSKFQFLRRFKQSTGVTPHSWLVRLRLEHACMMFKRGKHNIAQVATDVGFYDQSHFNRAFRRAYGVAPSVYQM